MLETSLGFKIKSTKKLMNIHSYLQHPDAVLVFHSPLRGRVEWEDYRYAAVRIMTAMQIELEQERAVIKPNLTSGEYFANPDTGITTHPGFVQGMVEYLREHGDPSRKITITEDPRNSDDNAHRHWKGTGFDRLAQETGAALHTPSTYTCVNKTVLHPHTHAQLNVSRLAVAPGSVLFNVPKLKTHNLAITTLCMKNLMGLVNVFDRHYCAQAWQELPEPIRTNLNKREDWFDQDMHAIWQAGLARRLIDTAQVIRPALNIIEGIVGREGTGFQRGRNRTLGLAVAGINMVAVDSLASYLMGFDPLHLVYTRLAAEAGLGQNDVHKLRVYVERDGELVLCPDIDSMRITPPFRVISGIKGESTELIPIP